VPIDITRQQPGDHIIHPTNHTIQLQEDHITSPIQPQGDLIIHPINHTTQLQEDLITSHIQLPSDHITSHIQLQGHLIIHHINHTIHPQGNHITRHIQLPGVRITRRNRILITSKDCCPSKNKLTRCSRRHTSWRFISVSCCKICF